MNEDQIRQLINDVTKGGDVSDQFRLTTTSPHSHDGVSGQRINVADLTGFPIKTRVYSTTTCTTLTPEKASYDIFHITALQSALTIANPTLPPNDGDQIRIRLLDKGTARGITFGTIYVAKAGIALPTTTVLSKNMEISFEYNANLSAYNLVALLNEA